MSRDLKVLLIRPRAILLLCFAFLLSACASRPGPAGGDSELMARYRAYAEAVAAGDLEVAIQYVPASKRQRLESMSESEARAALSVLSPISDLGFKMEWFDGEEAILIVTATVAENDGTGRIKMLREEGDWQILSEMWNLGSGSEFLEERDPPRTDAQKAAIRKLEERGYPMPSGDHLVGSADQGDLEAVRLFLEAGFSIESRDGGGGGTALISASSSGHPHVALFLIEQGADINATDETNSTPLMRAVDDCDMTEVVEVLIARGARLDIKSAGGRTALDLAGWGNCPRNAELIRAAER